MKNLIYLFVGALMVISCNTDPCKDKVCGTAGTCTEGICICDTGFEQDSIGACNVEWSAKFVGANMATTDTCYGTSPNATYNYNMSIARESAVLLSTTNLGKFGATNVVKIDVTASKTLSLNYTDVTGRKFTGSGSIANKKIDIDYVVLYADQTTDTCNAVVTMP